MLTPQELKLISYEEIVEVEVFSKISLSLLHNTYSLVPLRIHKLPLYIALDLYKSDLCIIRLPSCYTYSALISYYESECINKKEYTKLPCNIFSTGKLLIRSSYNVEGRDTLIEYIDKLKEVRSKKTLQGMKRLDGRALNLSNLTLSEWYEIKEVLCG